MSLFQKKSVSETEETKNVPAESVPYENNEKTPSVKRIPLTHRAWAKVVAFILAVLMIGVAIGSIAAAVFMVDQEIYTMSERNFKEDVFRNFVEGDVLRLIHLVQAENGIDGQDAVEYLSDRNVASVELIFSDGPSNRWGYDGGKTEGSYDYAFTVSHVKHQPTGDDWYAIGPYADEDVVELDTVEVSVVLANAFHEQDDYYFADLLITAMYDLQYWVYVIAVISVITAVACFIFLMYASGRRKGLPDPLPGWGTKIPLDLLAAATVFGGFLTVQLGYELLYDQGTGGLMLGLLYGLCLVAVAAVLIGFCMSFALRVKLGGWWKNTVVFYVLRLCWYLLRKLGVFFRWLGRGIAALFKGIPLIWKTVLLIVGLIVYNFFAILIGIAGDEGWLVILLVLEAMILLPALMYAALMLRKLYRSSEALAAGDLSYQIDTKHLVWDFKKAAENLNSIGCGMTLAVEERTKSERMKTELITNVSHDIKTPLTSIINYSDLIEKEPCDNEKITEYAGVLHRQSERLKRLIDDLVEASKASTGNLEVLLAPCELSVLLTQTAGEYMQRMEDAGLELITQMPEEDIRVMGDGRRMWRVFDNLANNACKYAMPGTRVYITMQKQNGMAHIAFKNTSKLPLNISADELMERFVRGDAARHTEGSGLGLSIAKSLTELQNGKLQISIDGDFFKVELRFPLIQYK